MTVDIVPGIYQPGQPGYIAPGSDAWRQCITPSKVAAILGESRWESPYRLWHRMKGLVDPEPPKDIFAVGHAFELALAELWKGERPGWKLSPGEVQIVLPASKFGFPAICTLDRRASRGSSRRVVEFKIARELADLDKWGAELTDDCPPDYWVQVQTQMLFSGMNTLPGNLMVCGPFWNYRIYEIEHSSYAFDEIVEKCQAFYASLSSDEAPDLDDSVPTYECVRQLHPDIDGSTVEIGLELAVAVHDANARHKAAEQELRGLKTQLLDQMGNAKYAQIAGGVKVADRRPHAKGGIALNLARKHPAA